MGEDLVAACITTGLESPSEPVTREVRPSTAHHRGVAHIPLSLLPDCLLSWKPLQRFARTARHHLYPPAHPRPRPLVYGGREVGRPFSTRIVRVQSADE